MRSSKYWVSPSYSTQQVGVVLGQGIRDPQAIQDLDGYRIASEIGSTSRQRLQAKLKHAQFVDVDSAHEGIAAVAQGHADIYVGLQTVNVAAIARLGLGTLRSVALPHAMIDLHFVTRRSDAASIAVITRGLASLTANQRVSIEATWISQLPALPGNPVHKPNSEQSAWLQKHSTLKVGIYSSRQPYDFLDDTNLWRGAGASILSAFAITYHLRIEPVLLSTLDDPFEELHDGNIDAITAVPILNVASDTARVSRPFDTVPWLLVSRAGVPAPLNRIGAQAWRIPHLSPNLHFSDDQLISYGTSDDAISALLRGEVDSAFVNLVAANQLTPELKNGKLLVDKRFSATEEIGFAVAPDNSILLGLLNDFIDAYPRDQLQEIVRRNHPAPVHIGYEPQAVLKVIIPIGLATLILFGILFWAYWRVRKAGKFATQAQAEADLARERAETADRAKSTFLATMSHEIRTPLSGIVGVIDVLQTTTLNQFQQHYIDLAKQSTKLLMGVINDVLDFSKIEAGKLTIEANTVDLYLLAEHLGGLYLPLTRQKSIGFFISAMPHFDRKIIVDEVRVSQILTNLISNAIRFTDLGYVHVKFSYHCGRQHAALRLSVADTGTGMPASYLQQLFEPFVQADGSATRRFGGTGLGLSIVKRLVDLMRGSIVVKSVLGQGTQVEVTLPMGWGDMPEAPLDQQDRAGETAALQLHSAFARPAITAWLAHTGIALADQDVPADWVIAEQATGILTINQAGSLAQSFVCSSELPSLMAITCRHTLTASEAKPASLSAPLSQPIAPGNRSAIRLMVAEDNDINRDIIEQQLLSLGIAATTARDGLDALEQWRSNPPTIMLVDCQMPRMDGYELARKIRLAEIGTNSHTLVIAITANASVEDERDCLAAGMDDFLSKPLTRQKLETALRKWNIIGADPIH